MPEPTSNPYGQAAADAGVFEHLRNLFSSSSSYLQARLQLAGLEAKEAGVHYLKLLLMVIAALVLLGFGYIFLLLWLAFFLAGISPLSWAWVTFIIAILHFAGVAIIGFLAVKKFNYPVFETTLQEFKKDQEWQNPAVPAVRQY